MPNYFTIVYDRFGLNCGPDLYNKGEVNGTYGLSMSIVCLIFIAGNINLLWNFVCKRKCSKFITCKKHNNKTNSIHNLQHVNKKHYNSLNFVCRILFILKGPCQWSFSKKWTKGYTNIYRVPVKTVKQLNKEICNLVVHVKWTIRCFCL